MRKRESGVSCVLCVRVVVGGGGGRFFVSCLYGLSGRSSCCNSHILRYIFAQKNIKKTRRFLLMFRCTLVSVSRLVASFVRVCAAGVAPDAAGYF